MALIYCFGFPRHETATVFWWVFGDQITASDNYRSAFELPVIAGNPMDSYFGLLVFSKFVPIVDQGIFIFVGATDF